MRKYGESKQIILQHYEELGAPGLQKQYGISRTYSYEVAKKYGLKRRKEGESVAEIVIRCFPTMSAVEIEKQYGIPRAVVYGAAKYHKVRHTEETIKRIYTERGAKTGKALRHTYAMDRLRRDIGEPTKTKKYKHNVSKYVWPILWKLEHKWGYIRTTDPHVLFYDEHTKRLAGLTERNTEEYYTKKYGIRFEADCGQ